MNDMYQEALRLAEHIADVGESPMELVKQLHRGGLLKGPSAMDITLDREQAEQRRRQALKEEHNTWVHQNVQASVEVNQGERTIQVTLRTRNTTIEGLILRESDAEQIRDTLTRAIEFIKEHQRANAYSASSKPPTLATSGTEQNSPTCQPPKHG